MLNNRIKWGGVRGHRSYRYDPSTPPFPPPTAAIFATLAFPCIFLPRLYCERPFIPSRSNTTVKRVIFDLISSASHRRNPFMRKRRKSTHIRILNVISVLLPPYPPNQALYRRNFDIKRYFSKSTGVSFAKFKLKR